LQERKFAQMHSVQHNADVLNVTVDEHMVTTRL